MTLLQPGRPPLHMPTRAQEVYDVTGAGDTVIGVLAATLASATPLEGPAISLTPRRAWWSVSWVHPPFPLSGWKTRSRPSRTGFGVMSEEELKQAVAAARKRGEKVVMTNGVFDILHAVMSLSGECAAA